MTETTSDISAIMETVYFNTLETFFGAFEKSSAIGLIIELLELADDLQTNANWFMATDSLIQSTLYDPIRSKSKLHVALVKLERLHITKLQIAGLKTGYLNALSNLFYTEINSSIVDSELFSTLKQGNIAKRELTAIPGLVGLLSIFLNRTVIDRYVEGLIDVKKRPK